MGKIILIASGKGGTGKTTVAANLGAALARRDNLTAVVDMDMGLRNLDIAMGLESSVVYDISDVIDKTCSLDDAVIRDNRLNNLYFVPAPQTRGMASLLDGEIKNVWGQLRSRFDYCIVDAPTGINKGFYYAAMCADAALIVSVPQLAALRDADRAICALEDMGLNEIKVIINHIRADMIDSGIMMNVDDCVDIIQIPVAGLIPYDDELLISSLKGELAILNENSRAGTALNNIAARIDGAYVPIMDFDDEEGLLKRVRRFLRR